MLGQIWNVCSDIDRQEVRITNGWIVRLLGIRPSWVEDRSLLNSGAERSCHGPGVASVQGGLSDGNRKSAKVPRLVRYEELAPSDQWILPVHISEITVP
jgi:hypothetical protein